MTIKNTIDSYRKRRQQILPLILGLAAVVLVVAGIVIVVQSMGGGGFVLFPTKTATPSITPTITNTQPPTETPTITNTPTLTATSTPSGPYSYTVKEGDTLTSIIEASGLAETENALVLIYILNPIIDPATAFITLGQTIILPPANYPLPSSTPLPTGLAPGARITYRVMPGDGLQIIANKLNSTVNAILLANKGALTEGELSVIYPGQLLLVPIDLVTPVAPTNPATATATQGAETATVTPSATP